MGSHQLKIRLHKLSERTLLILFFLVVAVIVARLHSLEPITEQFRPTQTQNVPVCGHHQGSQVLTEGWLFAYGNKDERARFDADGFAFQSVQVPQRWDHYGKENYRGHGWYRVRFKTPDPKPCHSLGLKIGPIRNTAEIFVNGTRMESFDKLPFNMFEAQNEFFRRTISIPSHILRAPGSDNVLAIHAYAQTGDGGIIHGKIILGDLEEIKHVPFFPTNGLLEIIPFFLLFVACSALYRFSQGASRDMALLYFAAFAFCSAAVIGLYGPLKAEMYTNASVSISMWFLGATLMPLWFLAFIHVHLEERSPLWWWTPTIAMGLLGVFGFLTGSLETMAGIWVWCLLMFPLIILHCFLVLLPAVKRRKPGALWLLVGNIATPLTGGIELVYLHVNQEPPVLFPFAVLVQALLILIAAIQKDSASEREAMALTRDLERRVEERTLSLQHAMEGLESKNRDLGAFADRVAHDLRSPLVTISMLSDVLANDTSLKTSDETQKTIAHIKVGAERMTLLLEGIVRLAKAGRGSERVEKVDLNAIVRDTLQMLDAEIKASDAKVMVDPDLPRVWGFPAEITTLMLNLVNNAIKHHGPGQPQVWIGINPDNIDHSLTYGRPNVVLTVEDDGPGILEEERNKVFLPFTRGTTTAQDGQGVGLAVVQRVVSQMGGNAWIEDGEERGARFCLALPRVTSEDKTDPSVPAAINAAS